jgi:hypothetical protein
VTASLGVPGINKKVDSSPGQRSFWRSRGGKEMRRIGISQKCCDDA